MLADRSPQIKSNQIKSNQIVRTVRPTSKECRCVIEICQFTPTNYRSTHMKASHVERLIHEAFRSLTVASAFRLQGNCADRIG